jgi:quinol monooxygenase YgiN
MSEDLIIRGSLRIEPGHIREFCAVAAEMLAVTKARDTRTIAFDTYLDEVDGTWIALERYPDSDALMSHFANQDPEIKARLLAISHLGTAEVFGRPTPELLAKISGYRPVVYTPLHSLD